MKMEILAPVGNSQSLKAAVYSGADAVYFGAKHFNARRNAENFDDFDLENTILFCKQNGVKAYLTLNILIKDSEINEALSLAQRAKNLGIDGIIVQDLGLARLIKENIKDIPLHASTQLSIHSAAAIPLLKSLGFSRVVPAREMSRENLKEFCKVAKENDIEVEVFVHGALCMCLSGQCFFSAHLGGRSANRGLCAGTCRLPFSAEGGTGYDLSLKDLSLVTECLELKDLGVSSLKIEGRMKRPEYVAASVNCLKKTIENKKAENNDLMLLEKVFSRSGFTKGYYLDKTGKDMFGVRTEQDISSTNDTLSKLHELYRRPAKRLGISFIFELFEGKPAKLTAKYQDLTVTEKGDLSQTATKKPLSEEVLRSSLTKLGGTPYFLEDLQFKYDEGLTLPISAINALKSRVIAALDCERIEKPTFESEEFNLPLSAKKRSIKGFFLRFERAEQVCGMQKNVFGFSLPVGEILKFSSKDELLKVLSVEDLPFAELYRGADDDALTLNILKKLKTFGIKTVVCSNLSAVNLAKSEGFGIFGGFGLNLYNNHALLTAKNLGILKGVISPELSFKEQAFLTDQNFETYSFLYGHFPLMLTKNCPVKNGIGCKGKKDFCAITDRLGETFPVLCKNGYSEILNSRPTNIADSLDLVSADYGYLYFTVEDNKEVKKVLDGFEKGVITSKPFTRGLTKNGVL